MPPKKKKIPLNFNKDDEELDDVFSYVELVQDCLERAESSQKACLEGIIKSDLALRHSQSDADIHFIVLVRRAELLLIAVKNKYDTSDLPAAHIKPLKSCINDCEQVIAKVSAADPISKGIYEQACTILKSAQAIQRSQSSEPGGGKGVGGTFQRYDPTKTLFRNVEKINHYLLQDVVNCYQHSNTVCRTCFYKHNVQEPIGANRHCRRCKRTTHPLVVIPTSRMCDNLIGAKVLAIPAPPKTQMARENKHKPFQMCKKSEHKLCFDKSASGDTWFAHSIEELVVWTVERHYDVKFNRYIEVYHRDHDPPDYSLFDGKTTESHVNTPNTPTAAVFGGGEDKRPYEYYPAECRFRSVASIPERLFWDVLDCYKNFKEYCKWCYYVKDERGVVVINRRSNSTMCSNCQKPWESVIVIPASSLCWNFGNFDELPIAMWPRDKPTRDPFEYCRKKDHYRCFRVYVESSFWYPHSVEELVIWTVEREKKCTFRQFMQKAIQLPSPVSSPRQTPPPAVASSPGIPIPVSSSPHHQQQQQQHSQLQNYSSTTHAMASYATVSSSPSKKKGPPSPLSLGGQSPPPPSFSSVAAGQSPKPTSPLLKLKQVTSPVKGQVAGGTMGAAINSVNNLPSSLSPSSSTTSVHTVANTAMMYAASDRGLMAGRQDVVSRPGRLADITGPATSLEHLGFSFIIGPSVTSSDISIATVSTASHIYLSESNLLPQQTFTVNNVGPWQAGVCLSSVKGGGGVGSGINTLAGGNSPLVAVASVSSRRNYRVASTSSDGAGSNINGGDFGQFNVSSKSRNSAAGAGGTGAGAGEVGSNYGIGVELSTVSSITSSSSSPALPHILEATMRSESVTLKAMYKFSEVNFRLFSDIPRSLLKGIAHCFKDKKLVCRKCFYGDRSISHLQLNNKCSTGEHHWTNPVVVIPGCNLCDNEPLYKHGEHVAVPPLPPVAIIKKCEKFNHHKCFAQSLDADQRFAHSVEELVVWMVESENECSFEQFVSSSGLFQPQLTLDQTNSSSNVPPLSLHQTATQATFVPQQSAPKPPSSLPTAAANPTLNLASVTSNSAFPSSGVGTNIAEQLSSNGGTGTNRPWGSYKSDVNGEKLYDPKKTEFVSIKDIPVDLLSAVAECFHNRLFVCRICFFESLCSKLVSKIQTKQAIMCELGHTPWKQIKVVPRCKLCITPSEHAPIPPLPKHMKNSNIPFAVCKKTEHQTCYAMSRGTNPWFPHTVEELVIWTVERDRGIEFEECYKEYLQSYAKKRNDLISVTSSQTFYQPVSVYQSTTAEPYLPLAGAGELQNTQVTGGTAPRLQSLYSKPLAQNGFNTGALDLANLLHESENSNSQGFDYTPAALTQPELYRPGRPYLGGKVGYATSSTQFDFSIPAAQLTPHPPATSGEPISGRLPVHAIPPLLANGNTSSSSANPGGIPSAIPTGNAFAEFFPALLSENPLNSHPQEVMASANDSSGEKSVTDLFNLTAGLDLPADFDNSLSISSSGGVNRERIGIGGSVLMNGTIAADIDPVWTTPVQASRHNDGNISSSVQANNNNNEKGSPFIDSSKELSKMNVGGSGSIGDPSHHAFGRMDSYEFITSVHSTSVHGFDTNLLSKHDSMHVANSNGAAAAVDNSSQNWSDFASIPNVSSPPMMSDETSPDTSNSSDVVNRNSHELALPRMPITEPYVLSKPAAQVKSEQAIKMKSSPKGGKKKKKKEKKDSGKSSPSETTVPQNDKVVMESSVLSACPQESTDYDFSSGEVALQAADTQLNQEAVSVDEERQHRNTVSYDLSSASAPSVAVVGMNSAPGFRSADHTPPLPTNEDVTEVAAVVSTTHHLESFSNLDRDAVLQLEEKAIPMAAAVAASCSNTELEHQSLLMNERDVDDIFNSPLHEFHAFSTIDQKVDGQSSTLLGSIMAARGDKACESDVIAQSDDSAYKLPAQVPALERIKDIEDESSQEESEAHVAEEEVAVAPFESSRVNMEHKNSPVVPYEEEGESIEEIMKKVAELDPPIEPETTVYNDNVAPEPTKRDDPVPQSEEVFSVKDSNTTAREESAAMEEHKYYEEDFPTSHFNAVNEVEGMAVGERSVDVNSERVSLSDQADVVGESAPTAPIESSVDPVLVITSETAGKHFLPEWDLSQSSDEFDLNIEGEDQTLQHVPIEDWGCTLSDDNN